MSIALGYVNESLESAIDQVAAVTATEVPAEVPADSVAELSADPAPAPTIPGLQAEVARLTEQLSSRERLEADISAESLAVDRAASEVLRCESAVEEAKGDLKSAKERYDKRVNALRDLVRDMAHGQGRLDFAGTSGEMVSAEINGDLLAKLPPAVDLATEAPVSELGKKKLKEIVGADEFDRAKDIGEPIGLTDGQVETIEGDGCQTIADLEKKLRDYPLFLTDLKGFGPSAQGRLSMSLVAWRKVNPEPVVETASTDE